MKHAFCSGSKGLSFETVGYEDWIGLLRSASVSPIDSTKNAR